MMYITEVEKHSANLLILREYRDFYRIIGEKHGKKEMDRERQAVP